MGMIADLDGPQFVAERRGTRVPELPEASRRPRIERSPLPLRERARTRAAHPSSVPGAVTALSGLPTPNGGLMLSWQAPPGGAVVALYRIERTREGRIYEVVAETDGKAFTLPPMDFNDPWFYRVSAFNASGQGTARWVIFYLRRRRNSIFQHIPVLDGLRVQIYELVRL